MKNRFMLAFVILSVFSFFAFIYINNSIDEILKKLNLSNEEAKEYIWSNCSGNYFSYPNPGELKNLLSNNKTEIVITVGNYVKAYVNSKEFDTKYAEFREMEKPEPPKSIGTAEDIAKEQIEHMKKGIAEMEQSMKNVPDDQKDFFKESIKIMCAQLAELEDPNNAMYSDEMDDYYAQSDEMQNKNFEEQLAEWEKEYPVSKNEMVKKWLNKFLEISSDVDFNAELKTNNYGKKIFVNPDYERKSDLWKLCFRSGKETVNAARIFTKNWLKELK